VDAVLGGLEDVERGTEGKAFCRPVPVLLTRAGTIADVPPLTNSRCCCEGGVDISNSCRGSRSSSSVTSSSSSLWLPLLFLEPLFKNGTEFEPLRDFVSDETDDFFLCLEDDDEDVMEAKVEADWGDLGDKDGDRMDDSPLAGNMGGCVCG